jgi:hypothetical protein
LHPRYRNFALKARPQPVYGCCFLTLKQTLFFIRPLLFLGAAANEDDAEGLL